jgi:hypothetical protein
MYHTFMNVPYSHCLFAIVKSGAVDGTLIPIIAPAEHEEAYVCRKGFHALNVQAVCDADMRYFLRKLFTYL